MSSRGDTNTSDERGAEGRLESGGGGGEFVEPRTSHTNTLLLLSMTPGTHTWIRNLKPGLAQLLRQNLTCLDR